MPTPRAHAPAPEPLPAGRHFLRIGEAAKALGVTRKIVLRYSRDGELTPRKGARGVRQYAASDVAALAHKLAKASGEAVTPGMLEGMIVELVAANATDAEIVRRLRVPFDLVARVRARASGADGGDADAEARAVYERAERDLETERAERIRDLEQRRRDRRK